MWHKRGIVHMDMKFSKQKTTEVYVVNGCLSECMKVNSDIPLEIDVSVTVLFSDMYQLHGFEGASHGTNLAIL